MADRYFSPADVEKLIPTLTRIMILHLNSKSIIISRKALKILLLSR